MSFKTLNPFTGKTVTEIDYWDTDKIDEALARCSSSRENWSKRTVSKRISVIQTTKEIIVRDQSKLAHIISTEMGKILAEANAEIEKCISLIDYYVDHAEDLLDDEQIFTDTGYSYAAYEPLGVVYAVMPWNFPFWQVFRFAIPALIAGNSVLMKHASNVPQCALAIEDIFKEAIDVDGVFISLMIDPHESEYIISNPLVNALTFTGSGHAGSILASLAGKYLKKSVLELGGSDPFIVIEDCNFESAIDFAMTSRFLNAGQSCIAAKRFIVVDAIADKFVAELKSRTEKLSYGDPLDAQTSLAPMARADLRQKLHQQVSKSISMGANPVTGCDVIEDTFSAYQASILDHVAPGMPAYDEELFGPVAAIIRVRDHEEALQVANDTEFGLGSSVWTKNPETANYLAKNLKAGCCFINGMVKSDPKLPFGGVKASGYGRELSKQGILEFVNVKTIWIKHKPGFSLPSSIQNR